LDGYCPVQLAEKERWVLGNRRWGVRHEGRTYLFAGPEEQNRFYANPEKYAPILAGDDVVPLIDQGERLPGRREHGAWYQGRVYLFSSEANLQKFSADPNRYISAVEQMRSSMAARPGAAAPSLSQPNTPAPWNTSGASLSPSGRYR
jgi:YHS domain-containing protein